MPEHYPDFPSREQMLEYLRDYAEKFGLRKHIQLNTKVVMAFRWRTESGSWNWRPARSAFTKD